MTLFTSGFFLYILVQFISFSTIILLTINAKNIENKAQSIQVISFFSNLLISFTLSIINSITPIVLRQITVIEKWDSSQTELNFLLFRIYLSNTLNSLILLFSYLLLIDPFLLGKK